MFAHLPNNQQVEQTKKQKQCKNNMSLKSTTKQKWGHYTTSQENNPTPNRT